MNSLHRTSHYFPPLLAALLCVSLQAKADVTLVRDGKAQCVIVLSPEVTGEDQKMTPSQSEAERETENNRRRLRESVVDLAFYLGKISGAKVEYSAGDLNDRRIPIYIGLADSSTSTLGVKVAGKDSYGQGFRVVVKEKELQLLGESYLATSYAVYEVLERLGCRWFMPSEMGESIPANKTITLPDLDFTSAPGTIYRSIWYGDEAFKRRTRCGGSPIAAGHALEHYVTEKQRAEHPEWRAIIKGQPSPVRLKWSNPGVQQAVANAIIAQLDKQYISSISLSPEDGGEFDESDDKAWDAGDYDPVMNSPSITDRYVKFCNIVAEQVARKYPKVKLGFLAYVQYTQAPIREKLHPSLVPMYAPINYCRAHAMTDNCASRARMKPMIEGWGKVAPGGVSYYNYMYNLAEYSAPYPMIHQMKTELPIIYANNVKYWQPEGMSNFDQVLPGLYLSMRKAWNPQEDSDKILDEFFTRFYGAAEKRMRRYWMLFDDQWIKVDEHAGGGWDYARRFTPEFMKSAREAMDEALAAAGTAMEYRRVAIQDAALKQFELWMQLVWDLNEGRLANLGPMSELWASGHLYLGNEYAKQYAFTKTYWSPNAARGWFMSFWQPPYLDAAKLQKTHVFIPAPLRQWKYAVDKEKQGEAQGWQAPTFDDTDWKTTDVAVERFATLGIPDYFGSVWYRQKLKAPAVQAGKKVYLWVSREDGDVKVWINGQAIPYVNAKGEVQDEFKNGYGVPVSFDITAALKLGVENQVTIRGTRVFINELGTGGLMGPVYLYRER
ncbi:MAG TPA: DUF4838 domain-containing protein [Chthoniobacteraceae bacterium]|jgi:hypothetical protein|nr:DUF4838 domain-containing protein [Chthoniobacteraceae bacterium]